MPGKESLFNPYAAWKSGANSFLEVVDNKNNGEGSLMREKILYPRVLNHIGEVSGKLLLDAGCGEGIIGRLALDKGAIVVGCDIVERFLREAVLRSAGREQVVLANLRRGLPFASNSFDVVCYNLVLMWFPEITTVAKETERIMKPGSKLVISLLHPWTGLSEVDETNPEKPTLILRQAIENGLVMRTINRTAGPFPYYQRSIAEYISTFTKGDLSLSNDSGFDEVSAPRDSKMSDSKKLFPEFLILTFLKGEH